MISISFAKKKKHPTPIDPMEIFRRLPKPENINDLYISQAEILQSWFNRRSENNLVIKLHTGGGKTLAGLLMAQSCINEKQEPVMYLCPDRQLVEQTHQKSIDYGIPALKYEPESRTPLPEDFFAAKKVLICTYKALFNGKSKFGVLGTGRQAVKVGAIILDDAHVAYSQIREQFSLKVEEEKNHDDFLHLTNIFKKDFDDIGKGGLFNDTITGKERYSILEVPYWSWFEHLREVHEYLRKDAETNHAFVWPFLRDNFEYSHVLISKNAFSITPYFPPVDLLQTFSNCPRKIFMSATIADDSSIIKTFDTDEKSASFPLTSNSLAGVSERMILIPEWTNIIGDRLILAKNMARWSATEKKVGTVILTPSEYISGTWSDVGDFVIGSEQVFSAISKLQTKSSFGPYIFANRYDGIDLPDDACRLLIFANMPRGANDYENYLANLFEGSVLNNALAQKIEQGIGRGARGSRDFCVVLLFGKDVLSWIASKSNSRFLTRVTRAQLEIGKKISENVKTDEEFEDAIQKCLSRDPDWIRYHAETLADLTETDPVDVEQLKTAVTERSAFQLWKDGNHEKAIEKITKHINSANSLDNETAGWLLQFAARIASSWKRNELAVDLQKQAFAKSKNLFRPKTTQYERLLIPGKQAQEIVSQIEYYRIRQGHLSKFDELISHLVPEASSNQFEQALMDLGCYLGFSTERPEKIYNVGPDVLWILDNKSAWIIEVKSKKNQGNPLTKEQHGQLLNAEQWFVSNYTSLTPTRVSLSPTILVTDNTVAKGTKVLTFEKLNELIYSTRSIISTLCNSLESDDQLVYLCEQTLTKNNLTPNQLPHIFLQDFQD